MPQRKPAPSHPTQPSHAYQPSRERPWNDPETPPTQYIREATTTNPRRDAIRGLLTLLRPFRAIVAVPIALGMTDGLAIALLLTNINNALHSKSDLDQDILLSFGRLCLLALVSSIVSDTGISYAGRRIITKLRKELGEKVLSAPIEQIERYRTHRLIPVLTYNIGTISNFSFPFTPLAIALTITFGCLNYLAYLSAPTFLLTVIAIVIGTAAQYLAHSRGFKGFYTVRDPEDELQKHYTAVTSGVKELCIRRPRRYHMHTGRIGETTNNIRDLHISSISTFILAETSGSMLFSVVISPTLTLQVYWPSSSPATITGFVMVLLYMKGPLKQVVTILPIVSRAQIAFQRVTELSERFSSPEPHLLLSEQEAPDRTVDSLELRDVRYSPPVIEGSEPSHLGPINLRIAQGDIVFIVGENGCGKTALTKLLLSLYRPQSGEILLDGESANAETRDDYRRLLSTIFIDCYLFNDPIQGKQALLQNAIQYLQHLEIVHRASVVDGSFSTADLSIGQRKRLASIGAWLGERPVLVFGEWAADQGPAFRRVFYTELLPDLKRQGKTIIVISRGDHYFEMTDQLIRLSAGGIIKETETA